MLDSDLAELYGVETRVLNQAVKRNIDRFPEDFMFQLTKAEFEHLRFQNGTSINSDLISQTVTSKQHGGRRKLPYVFTEQGVAMLSAVLKSDTAVKMSVQIIKAFIAMRKFIIKNAEMFQKLDRIEHKHLEYDKKFESIFKALENKDNFPKQGIFFDGQIFDAYKFVSDLIRSARNTIILVDNYIDDSVLTLLTKRKKKVQVIIYTKKITKQLELDLKKYNTQYPSIKIREFKKAHDRFLIIDQENLYHFGASLKDLGKKWFAFSKFDSSSFEIIEKLNKNVD